MLPTNNTYINLELLCIAKALPKAGITVLQFAPTLKF